MLWYEIYFINLYPLAVVKYLYMDLHCFKAFDAICINPLFLLSRDSAENN